MKSITFAELGTGDLFRFPWGPKQYSKRSMCRYYDPSGASYPISESALVIPVPPPPADFMDVVFQAIRTPRRPFGAPMRWVPLIEVERQERERTTLRAGGACICDYCGREYAEHETVIVADTDSLYLVELCDGTLVKL